MGNTFSQALNHPLLAGLIPGGTRNISSDQLAVVNHIRAATLFCAAWSYFGYKYFPFTLSPLPTMGERLGFALQCQLPSVVFMYSCVMDVATMRWRTDAINPLNSLESSEETDTFQVRRNILANTTEQLIINAGSQLVLSTCLQESEMKMIPVLSSLFLIGRIAFAKGYLYSPMHRGIGFSITTLSSSISLISCGYLMSKALYLGNGPLHWRN